MTKYLTGYQFIVKVVTWFFQWGWSKKILEFPEFTEMERSPTKFEFCSRNKKRVWMPFWNACVCVCVPGSPLASCKISRNAIQTWPNTGHSKLILLNHFSSFFKHECVVASWVPPTGDLACATRHVPWLGIEPGTIWFTGQHSIHWATPVRAKIFIIKKNGYVLLYYWQKSEVTKQGERLGLISPFREVVDFLAGISIGAHNRY